MKRKIIFIFLFFLVLVSIQINATTYYVNFQTGNDSNDGLTENFAWKHAPGDSQATEIPKTKALFPGDIISLKGGISYNGTIEPAYSGTAENPIIYAGDMWGSERAIIDAEFIRSTGISITPKGDYVRIQGFEIKNTNLGSGINIATYNYNTNDGHEGVQIVNNFIHDIKGNATQSAGRGIYVRYSNNTLIEKNEITKTGYHCIVLESNNATIRENHLYECGCDGIAGGASGLLIIDKNYIHTLKAPLCHPDGIQILGFDTLIVSNNVFHDATQNIFIEPYSNPVGQNPADAAYIFNNIVYNTQFNRSTGLEGNYNGISIDQRYNRIGEMYVFSNTLGFLNGGHGGLNCGTDFKIGKMRVFNNIFYNSQNNANARCADDFLKGNNICYNQYRNMATWCNDQWNQDPLLVDPFNWDFHLKSNSIAIDNGINLSSIGGIEFNMDKGGIIRPQNLGWDIGAYEYISENQTTETNQTLFPPAINQTACINATEMGNYISQWKGGGITFRQLINYIIRWKRGC